MMPFVRFLLAVLTCFVLVGCGGPDPSHPAIGRTVGNLPLVALADPDRPAPAYEGKVTLLNFWGTWCPPCRRELPGMARLATRLADDPRFQLVAVSCGGAGPDDLDEITATTTDFLQSQRIHLDAWADPDGMTRTIFATSFGFDAYPTTYLIGPDATVRAVWTGYRSRDEADMAAAVVTLLKEVPAPGLPAGR
ncbi:MAG: TlpA disulfide reductase family protein [Planctomycetia bacterium]